MLIKKESKTKDENNFVIEDDHENVTNISLAVCRICFSGETSGAFGEGDTYGTNLMNSCGCTGSCGYYHRYCLEEWINKTKARSCELCKESFYMKEITPSFTTFICDMDYASEVQSFLNSIFCLILVNMFNYVLCFCLMPGFFHSSPSDEFKYEDFLVWKLTFDTPIFFIIILILSLLFWWKTQFTSFCKTFKYYKKANMKFSLCNRDEKDFFKYMTSSVTVV
ncbi:Zinc finger, RING-CH-type domain and Zinc finger, RING/FYVE/PHD-type domain-containing protein [Strongyloides ratti]|uniref:Zinc finger, RING-CH-type domain and Zinc finger, RING/FYVE/PHD-type domain-containing protein n=1 Tax=Strongyloides ratti TaxID=34506 RepID=A0A090MW71_STRRB|nr:Zinc finger, RING-CH-type domain and Zinc finger, RING/FYVE/PHD-type domain-containing protein [Strongyloides ratti]CEF63493.1 Zinc finger, RING-CH-type domain and Zinc finger, RING/FYVE/PHD-type domain-containing protein [Strongyloides ratti]